MSCGNFAQSQISVRLAAVEDALCLSALGTQVFLDTYATSGVRASLAREVSALLSEEAFVAQLSNSGVRILLAEREVHLVGFAEVWLETVCPGFVEAPAVELRRLYVQSHFQRRGVGSLLLRRAEELACAEGASTLWLTAWLGNARALAFYPAQGYKQLGSTDYVFEGESFENRLFAKALGNRETIQSADQRI